MRIVQTFTIWLICSSAVAQIPYAIERIATTTGPLAGFFGYRVSLNDMGEVSFTANLDQGGMGVFLHTQGGLELIHATDEEFRGFDPPVLNIHGTIVYKGLRFDGTQAILRHAADVSSVISNSADPRTGFFGPVSLTDNDQTVFVRHYWIDDVSPDMSRIGHTLLVANGASVVSRADTSGAFSFIGYASINARGDVAFAGAKDDGTYGAFLLTPEGRELLAETIGGVASGPVSINNTGQVAANGNTPQNDQAVLVWDGESIATIADGSGPFGYLGIPDINEAGQVVFDASLDPFTPRGIFMGPDPIRDAVVLSGEMIDGVRMADLISYPQINNHGQIAFIARLADGTEGVFLATPIPEPTTAALAIVALFGGLICAYWRYTTRNRATTLQRMDHCRW